MRYARRKQATVMRKVWDVINALRACSEPETLELSVWEHNVTCLFFRHPHHDFAFGAASFQIGERVGDPIERKYTVDNRLEFLVVDEPCKFRQLGTARVNEQEAIRDTVSRGLPPQAIGCEPEKGSEHRAPAQILSGGLGSGIPAIDTALPPRFATPNDFLSVSPPSRSNTPSISCR